MNVTKIDTNAYRVESQSGNGSYVVRMHAEGFATCTCKGYAHARRCKHERHIVTNYGFESFSLVKPVTPLFG